MSTSSNNDHGRLVSSMRGYPGIVSSYVRCQAKLCCTPAPTDYADMLTWLGGHRLGSVLAPLTFLNGLLDFLLFEASYFFEAGTVPCCTTESCGLATASINSSCKVDTPRQILKKTYEVFWVNPP